MGSLRHTKNTCSSSSSIQLFFIRITAPLTLKVYRLQNDGLALPLSVAHGDKSGFGVLICPRVGPHMLSSWVNN